MAAKQSGSIGLESRLWAFRAIQNWRANPNQFVSDFLNQNAAQINERDMALARELAAGVVRFCGLFETLSKPMLKREQPDQALLDVLSVLAYQIFNLEGIPDHAIGNTGVELCQRIKRPAWKSVVNALCRKLIGMRDESVMDAPRIAASHIPKKAHKRLSLTKDFIKDLKRDFPQDWSEIAQQLNTVAPVSTRMKPGVQHAIDDRYVLRQEGAWMWWHRVQDAVEQIIDAGLGSIQDQSQAHVETLAAVQPGELVLDLCAAPGGKTQALRELGATVISADIARARLDKTRTLNPGRCLVQDGKQPACQPVFDCVLVDVPCSNSGVFARRPEARWRYQDSEVAQLQVLQADLLMAASQMVKPGGRLIYSTCSINKQENHDRCAALPGWDIKSETLSLPNQWHAGAYAARLEAKKRE